VTLFDRIRIALGTLCLAITIHPFISSSTEVREHIECQLWSMSSTRISDAEMTYKCGGAEVAMSSSLLQMGMPQTARAQKTGRSTTRWLSCRLVVLKSPILFGLAPDVLARHISNCKPLLVSQPPLRRWICFMARRGTCHA
jgi:hypothetical protein